MPGTAPLGLPCSPLDGSVVIAGPCSAESRRQVIDIATDLAASGVKIFRAGVWKPRTRPGGFEGMGDKALAWLAEAKEITGMLTATEVATKDHVKAAVESGVDLLWIGARTTANPFAVQEIADELEALGIDIPVLVKNPVSPDLELWIGALQRLYNSGIRRLGAVHRGFSAYGKHLFRNPPHWQIPAELRRRCKNIPIIGDPSHISGKHEFVGALSQQALDIGFDGLMVEVHCNPVDALSDARQQITPKGFKELMDSLKVRKRGLQGDSLDELRSEIDRMDDELIDVLSRRMAVSREIGDLKRSSGMPVLQTERFDSMLRSRIETAEKSGLEAGFIKKIMSVVHEESIRQQIKRVDKDVSSE